MVIDQPEASAQMHIGDHTYKGKYSRPKYGRCLCHFVADDILHANGSLAMIACMYVSERETSSQCGSSSRETHTPTHKASCRTVIPGKLSHCTPFILFMVSLNSVAIQCNVVKYRPSATVVKVTCFSGDIMAPQWGISEQISDGYVCINLLYIFYCFVLSLKMHLCSSPLEKSFVALCVASFLFESKLMYSSVISRKNTSIFFYFNSYRLYLDLTAVRLDSLQTSLPKNSK